MNSGEDWFVGLEDMLAVFEQRLMEMYDLPQAVADLNVCGCAVKVMYSKTR